jgi:C1A family cysteine protease
MVSLMDLTGPEGQLRFGLRLNRPRTNESSNAELNAARAIIPDKVDLRSTFVTPPKFQSTCGSCWAFVTTGVMESLMYTNSKARREYSVQQLIDCAHASRSIPEAMKNWGCLGIKQNYLIQPFSINFNHLY